MFKLNFRNLCMRGKCAFQFVPMRDLFVCCFHFPKFLHGTKKLYNMYSIIYFLCILKGDYSNHLLLAPILVVLSNKLQLSI